MRLNFLSILALCFAFVSCNNESRTSAPVTYTMTEASAKNCLEDQDTICAEIKLSYPVLAGGANPSAIKAINDSLLSFVYLVIGENPKLPLPQAFDSASINLYSMLVEQYGPGSDREFAMSFTNELNSKVLYLNSRLISVEMSNYAFTGGAHGNYGSALSSFLLESGKMVDLTDIVADTTALRPLLEAGFIAAKNTDGEQYKLEDLLFPESIPLPMPLQWCVVQEGLRVTYNPYEVAPYAVGQTDITLSWDQLGKLADRSKWISN